MDHLPLPDGVHEHILVPFLPGIPYDNEGFIDCDKRQGWDIKRLRQGDIRGARSEWNDYSKTVLSVYEDVDSIPNANLVELLVGPFIQNWLFYGIFQTALRRPIHLEEGVVERADSNGVLAKYLSSRALFQEFASRRNEFGIGENGTTALSDCLKTCAWILEDLDALSDELGGYVIPGPMHLALSSLIQTIDEYSAIWHLRGIPQATASVSHARWLEHDLADRGWCIFRISRLNSELGIGGLYYASIIPNSPTDRSHTECIKSTCVAYNVLDNESYVQHHRDSLCRCKSSDCLHHDSKCLCKASCAEEDLKARVGEFVVQGEIPLISIEHSENGISFKIAPFREASRYVAISHVWSDGLGNPSENMIPPCQAEYLHSVAGEVLRNAQTDMPVYFWLDTLCVPLEPDAVRWAAIEMMHKIYSNATIVLVLTEELMTCALPSSTDEILIRILQCKWMTRLWTMQEGILARELAFQFRDRAIDYVYLDDLHAQVFTETPKVSHIPASKANLAIASKLSFEESETRAADRLRSFWFAIRHRTTSRMSDQAICAGILCRLDLSKILAAPNEEKMTAFWQGCKETPLSVLWTNGPRLQTDTMRWAPQSLIDPRTWAVPPSSTQALATVSKEGLCFSGVEALAFPALQRPTTEDSLIEFKAPLQRGSYHMLLAKNVGNPSWDDLSDHWSNIVLLWDRDAPHEFFGGIIVSVVRGGLAYESLKPESRPEAHEGQRIYARWLAQVTVLLDGSDWHEMVSHFPTRFTDEGSPIRELLDVQVHSENLWVVPHDYSWCVS